MSTNKVSSKPKNNLIAPSNVRLKGSGFTYNKNAQIPLISIDFSHKPGWFNFH